MEREDLIRENLTFALLNNQPVCSEWKMDVQDAVYHLANMFLVLGFMGGSGFYGLLYLFFFLALGFLCTSIWAWMDACAADIFSWNFTLLVICAVQIVHVAYQLRSVTFDREFKDLYGCIFQQLAIPLTVYGEIVSCCDGEVTTLEKDHCYAVEGKTPIQKLAILLSGRIRVTVNGEFLHFIYPYQFLDSPEWDSLRPSDEATFQVTLRADTTCRYVGWRRKKMYLLFAKHRYIAKVFSVLIGNDIAEKLFSLSDKVYDRDGIRYDLRLPSLCHVVLPDVGKNTALGSLSRRQTTELK